MSYKDVPVAPSVQPLTSGSMQTDKEKHLRMRELLKPALQVSNVKAMLPTLLKVAQELCAALVASKVHKHLDACKRSCLSFP